MAYGDWLKLGDNVLVSPATRAERRAPSIAGLSNGNYVVAWYDYNASTVVAQIVMADGTKVGSEFLVYNGIGYPSVTSLDDGGFAISLDGVTKQPYDATGSKVGSPIPVASLNFSGRQISGADRLANGGFVNVWADNSGLGGDGDGYAVKAQIFNPSGVSIGPAFVVNTTTQSDQVAAKVATLANGNFVVSWWDFSTVNKPQQTYIPIGTSIKAQIYTPTGAKIGSEMRVDTTADLEARIPTITLLSSGSFLVTWSTIYDISGTERSAGIRGQIFDASGAKVGREFGISSGFVGIYAYPVVTALANGGFTVAWSNEYEIHAQSFLLEQDTRQPPVATFDYYNMDKNGVLTVSAANGVLSNDSDPNGDMLTAQLISQGPQHGTLALNLDGSFVYTPNAGYFGTDTFQYYASDGYYAAYESVNIHVLGEYNLFGTWDADYLYSDNANDTLNGWFGADTMTGLAGNDIYYVDNVGDVVVEKPNEGTDTVRSGISYVLGANVENLELLYSGRTYGTGNALANTITGNGSDNVLYGLAGNDTLIGGGGNDTLYGGTGADAMAGGTGNDLYTVDDAGDTITEIFGEGIDTVRSGISYTLSANVENLTLLYNGRCWGTGNELGNTITGNTGDNVLRGMAGNDTLTGGLGADAFVFNTPLNASTNVDAITDFSVSQGDVFWLDDAVFTALAPGALQAGDFVTGTAASNAAQNVIYDSATGSLFYDADGLGGAAQVKFASVTPGTALTASQFVVI